MLNEFLSYLSFHTWKLAENFRKKVALAIRAACCWGCWLSENPLVILFDNFKWWCFLCLCVLHLLRYLPLTLQRSLKVKWDLKMTKCSWVCVCVCLLVPSGWGYGYFKIGRLPFFRLLGIFFRFKENPKLVLLLFKCDFLSILHFMRDIHK